MDYWWLLKWRVFSIYTVFLHDWCINELDMCGSVIGSNICVQLRTWVCPRPTPHQHAEATEKIRTDYAWMIQNNGSQEWLCIIILRQCLTLKGLQGAVPVPTSCPCDFVLSCAYMLSFLVSGLWSAAKTGFSWFAKDALPEEYLSHNFDEHCLEDTRLIWHLSYPSGGD